MSKCIAHGHCPERLILIQKKTQRKQFGKLLQTIQQRMLLEFNKRNVQLVWEHSYMWSLVKRSQCGVLFFSIKIRKIFKTYQVPPLIRIKSLLPTTM